MTTYWTRKERERLRRDLNEMNSTGFHDVERLEAFRILATVDALEEALRDTLDWCQHNRIYPEGCEINRAILGGLGQ